jgi:hypothetical protein
VYTYIAFFVWIIIADDKVMDYYKWLAKKYWEKEEVE